MKNSIKSRFDDLIYSLNVKYNLFYNNHQYKNSYFKDDEKYIQIQETLSNEIQSCENEMKDLLQIFIHENFEDAKIIAYDSRSICVAEGKENIGQLLMTNITKNNLETLIQKIKEYFEFGIKIDLLEDLPEDIKNKFTF